MLADRRATDALVNDFAAQWLNLRRVDEVVVHPDIYPSFDDSLLEAFKKETELFVAQHAARGSQRARSAARRLHVRQRAAGPPLRHSGHLRQPLPPRHAAEPRSARRAARARRAAGHDLVPGPHVAGAARQVAARQHLRRRRCRRRRPASTRACRKRSRARCRRPSASGWRSIAAIRCAAAATRSSIRRASRSRTSTRSAAGGPSTNRAGRWMRAAARSAAPSIDGLSGLRALLLNPADRFPRTVTEKLLAYALGRRLDYYDRPAVRKIVRDAAASDYRWSSLILGIVNSPAFLMRATPATTN